MQSTHLQRFFLLTALASSSAGTNAEALLDIYELALKNDPAIQAAEATFKAGDTVKRQALAVLLPQINGNFTYGDTSSNTNSASFFQAGQTDPFGGLTKSESKSEEYSVTLTQNIFNLSAFFGYKQSGAVARQAALRYGIAKQDLILRSAEAYFNVLRGKDNLTSSLAEEKAIAQQLEQTQQRYEVGLIAITDVHEAQAAYDLAIANRLTEEVNLGIAYESLAAITGHQHSNINNLSAEFPVKKPAPEKLESWVVFAEKNNLPIQLSEQLLKAANQNAKVKKSNFAPKVQAIARYAKGDNEEEIFDRGINLQRNSGFNKNESTTFELSVDLPIFSGGTRNAERKQANYERVAEQANLVAAKRQAIQDTRSSYLTTVTDTARVQARKRAITSAQSALDATQAGYDAGTRNIVDLLNAQRDLYRAQRDYANTRYDYVINSLLLKQAAGIISPKDIQDINKWLEPPVAVLKSETAS